jgi:aspartate kinase
MHQVYELITKDDESKIVVLSALSGTTNALVDISNSLSAGNKTEAKQKIDTLEAHYHAFVLDLLKTEALIAKGNAIVKEHFEFLNIITKISFSDALNKDILAQGELMSTKLFCCYLEQQGQDHLLLPALDFMVLDQNEEPNLQLIRSKLNTLLAAHTDKKIFITQGYICKNVRGEVDNLKRGGSDYTASLVAAACKASVCEIWTDIDGMHNNDPRIVNKTVAIEF